MSRPDIQRLMTNMDDDQLDIITGILLRMATVKSEKWTGQITFVLNTNMGGLRDMHVNRGEIVRPQKGRKVRSGGV